MIYNNKEKYTIYISHSLVPKNKLQKDVEEALRKIRHTLYHDLDKLKKDLTSIIDTLNKKHHRCKPVIPRIQDYYTNPFNLSIWDIPNLTASILILKEEEEND